MCGFCTLLSGASHWSESGTNSAQSDTLSGRARMIERHHRVRLVNRLLAHYGCKLSNWSNNSYILKGQRGQTSIVESLPQVWAKAEEISKKTADPLDQSLLEKLFESALKSGT